MTTLPMSVTNSVAVPAFLETYRFTTGFVQNPPHQNESSTPFPARHDSVTLSKKSTQPQNRPGRNDGLDIQNIFTSYADILQRQQRAQNMIEQDLAVNGDTYTGGTSVLNRYQTLQYQQNSFDRIFNLKDTFFQGLLNATI
jgi:hypothetical protein